MKTGKRQIISRADDAGSAPGANRAILAGLRARTITAVGFMVPGPAFHDAVTLLHDELAHADTGLHATLNAEWNDVRWGPVLGAARVPSLVDEQGHFFRQSHLLVSRLVPGEVESEICAQLSTLRAAGLSPTYLDTHMGIDRLPGVSPLLERLAASEGLRFVAREPAGLPDENNGSTGDLLASWLNRIGHAPAGVFQLVTHPGTDTPDLHAFVHDGLTPGQIARERAREAAALCDPRFLSELANVDARLVRFSDL